jgi:hypothetical protein
MKLTRAHRLITIYDCKVVLAWEGTASDGTEVKGTLTIPEVSHEQLDGLEDYTVRSPPRATPPPSSRRRSKALTGARSMSGF